MLMKHKQKCGDGNITTIKTSNESHLHWKKHFHKNPLYFRIYADFEADNEKDNSVIGNKTKNIYKQNPVLNGYHIVSELNDVLKSDYYKSPLGYNNVDWFVDEVDAKGMIFKWERTGIIMNFTMDVDPGYKYIEKFHGGVQWYMMESKDIISSICFKLKNENGNLV